MNQPHNTFYASIAKQNQEARNNPPITTGFLFVKIIADKILKILKGHKK